MKTKNLLILLEREMEEVKQLKRLVERANQLAADEHERAQWAEQRADRLEQRADRLQEDVYQLQTKLDALKDDRITHLEPSMFQTAYDGPGWSFIPLVKSVREYTGLGLKEAKDIVDGWRDKGLVPIVES